MLSSRPVIATTRRTVAALAVVFSACVAPACTGPDVTSPPVTPHQPGSPADTVGTQPGGPNLVYRYNAKFEPPMGRVVHGVGQWAEYNAKYATLLPATLQPASELSFIPIADSLRPWNPAQIAAGMAAMEARGRIPLMDLSLFAGKPTKEELALMSDKLFGVDDEIAGSTKWDARLNDFVNVLKAHKKPVLLRIGGEFNGSWNGYHPYDFPKAWRKIVNMFRAAGAGNVAFVWCYEPAAPDDFDAKNSAGEWKWYPGDDVVDWFSIDLFSANDVGGPTSGHGAPTAFAHTTKFLDMAVSRQRPVVIAESSPAHYDLASNGVAAWSEWFTPYFGLIAARPEIEWFVYINFDWGKSSFYASNGWMNNDLSANPALGALYAGELAKDKYLHSAERSLLKDYDKYK